MSISPARETMTDILHRLFRGASDEVFEDGMDSDFSNGLHGVILEHGVEAVAALDGMISADGVNPEVAAEALVWVGRIDDQATHDVRLSVLERALESPDVCIRDGASIGIEAMDDPAAVDSLRRAIGVERCGLLRDNLRAVLGQLTDAGRDA